MEETVSPHLDYYYRRGMDFTGLLDAVHADAPELSESEGAVRALRLLAQVMGANEVRLTRLANLLERADAELEVEDDDELIRLRMNEQLVEKLAEQGLVRRVTDEEKEGGRATVSLQLIDVTG